MKNVACMQYTCNRDIMQGWILQNPVKIDSILVTFWDFVEKKASLESMSV